MYTKNKRKYQNKPAQRSLPRSAAPAPKFKNKKDKFMKETLPCIVLLIFMAFWSIGSAISIWDKVKPQKSSMITASAAEGDLVYSASLDGLRGMYYHDDFTYISMDNASISFTYNTIGRVSVIDFYLGEYSVSIRSSPANIQCDFISPVDSLDYSSWLIVTTLYNGLSYIDENFILESIQYSQHLPRGIVVDFIFRSMTSSNTALVEISIDSVDEYELKLPNYYTQYVGENQVLINNLRLEIARLQEQIEVNASIIATKDSQIESLNAEIESLNAEIESLNAEIESLNAEIESLQSSYRQGYDTGYEDGKAFGRIEGIESANDYSFMSLIGAVVDAPVKAFTGLFDWNLLGINLKQFFFSLLSLCTVLLVVKLILR